MQSTPATKPRPESSSRPSGIFSRILAQVRALHPARRSQHGREGGVVLVEFAFVLPLLLILLLLILDFGRAINYWIDTTHLASEGARLAAVDKAPGGGTLQEYIKSQADTDELRTGGTAGGVVAPGIEVCIEHLVDDEDGTQGQIGDPVKVTVSTQYDWIPMLGNEFDIGRSTISSSATHRIERVVSGGTVEPDGTCP